MSPLTPPAGWPSPRSLLAEGLGTALLLIAIVGSGIMASDQSPSDSGLQLLQVAVVTGAALVAIILTMGPISGAHLNPAVTLAEQLLNRTGWRRTLSYATAQTVSGSLGVIVANLMFGLPAIDLATTPRTGPALWLGETVATFGLVLIIFTMARNAASTPAIAIAVGAYIAGAHFFTSSTSFANPAVTLARTLSDTFTGITPKDTAPFLAAQMAGTLLAALTVHALHPKSPHPT